MIKVVLSSIIDIISGGSPQTSIEEYWNNGNIGWLSVTDFNNDLRFVYDSEKKIPQEKIKKLLEILRFTPSSVNIQPWHFVVALLHK